MWRKVRSGLFGAENKVMENTKSGRTNLEGVLGLGVSSYLFLSSAVSPAPLAGASGTPWPHGIHRPPWTLGE